MHAKAPFGYLLVGFMLNAVAMYIVHVSLSSAKPRLIKSRLTSQALSFNP